MQSVGEIALYPYTQYMHLSEEDIERAGSVLTGTKSTDNKLVVKTCTPNNEKESLWHTLDGEIVDETEVQNQVNIFEWLFFKVSHFFS